jgi:hypothetical protein
VRSLKHDGRLGLARPSGGSFVTLDHRTAIRQNPASRYSDAGKFKRTDPAYEIGYYVDGNRRDLPADMKTAADWCEAQLSAIEQQVPVISTALSTPHDIIREVPFITPDGNIVTPRTNISRAVPVASSTMIARRCSTATGSFPAWDVCTRQLANRISNRPRHCDDHCRA